VKEEGVKGEVGVKEKGDGEVGVKSEGVMKSHNSIFKV
jgi:hypothetical protein